MSQSNYVIMNQRGHYFRMNADDETEWTDNIGLAWVYHQYMIAFDIARTVGGRVVGN